MAADIDYVRINKKSHAKKTVGNIFLYLVLTLWAVIVLFPFYWMVVTSIKGYGAYNSEKIPSLIATSPTLENYKKCIHISASFKISGKYFVVYRCDNCIDVGCGDTCGLCLCKDEIQG